ncbi:MAG: hypothetical protein JST06_03365 [Bacteroidetes bacterium]|nr:hypothetical protein [Bacteroidota bacterium]MBS1630474.1 hypothetical protein [Bacteroidota bacterium]
MMSRKSSLKCPEACFIFALSDDGTDRGSSARRARTEKKIREIKAVPENKSQSNQRQLLKNDTIKAAEPELITGILTWLTAIQ